MTRIAIGIEYQGTAYAGWQAQPALPTVQGLVEAALSRVADAPVKVIGAGRTDAGVHARAQVAHFDTQAVRSARGWALGANTHLPADISIAWATAVPDHFHARYSAEARTYRYVILNRGTRSALAAGRAALITDALDAGRMRAAAAWLVGEHDFTSFRSVECQSRSPVRRLQRLEVVRQGEWVVVQATANAFLHHMVRNLAGLLIAVGRGVREPDSARTILQARDRTRNAATAPAAGLYMWHVRYPAAFALPQGAEDRPIEGPPGPRYDSHPVE